LKRDLDAIFDNGNFISILDLKSEKRGRKELTEREEKREEKRKGEKRREERRGKERRIEKRKGEKRREVWRINLF
jgi:hypothetical protein